MECYSPMLQKEVSVMAASRDSKGNPITRRSYNDGGLFVSTDNPQVRVMADLVFVKLESVLGNYLGFYLMNHLQLGIKTTKMFLLHLVMSDLHDPQNDYCSNI